MNHVTQSDRLQFCALVCSTWQAAAIAGTTVVQLERCSDHGSLRAWLSRHCNVLKGLQLKVPGLRLDCMLCSKLQQLQLVESRWDSSSRLLEDLAAGAAGLTRMELRSVTVDGTRGLTDATLQQLGALTSLQALTLWDLGTATPAALGNMLSLQQLTSLMLISLHMDLTQESGITFNNIPGLRKLTLTGEPPNADNEAAITFNLQPSVLQNLPHLEQLLLAGVNLVEGAAELLPILTSLMGLTWLSMSSVKGLQRHSPDCYASLLRIQRLRELRLRAVLLGSRPRLAHRQLFPAGLQAPQIEHLTWDPHDTIGQYLLHYEAVSRIVGCCPNLRTLELTACGPGSLAVAAHLPHLTHLHLTEGAYRTAELAALTGLESLRLSTLAHRIPQCLSVITSLSRLTQLQFDDTYSAYLARAGLTAALAHHTLVNQAPPGAPSDVCAQLAAIIAAAPSLAPPARNMGRAAHVEPVAPAASTPPLQPA